MLFYAKVITGMAGVWLCLRNMGMSSSWALPVEADPKNRFLSTNSGAGLSLVRGDGETLDDGRVLQCCCRLPPSSSTGCPKFELPVTG